MFWVGVGLFFGLHVMPSFPKLRDGLIGRLGENPYKGVYSLIVLMGMVLIVMG
ncbi:MAG: hypothetical protein JKY20_07225 [Alphaproteobacteria bacterium]|nr:hypothetical protein [Alphaproteobacteria bacterium]